MGKLGKIPQNIQATIQPGSTFVTESERQCLLTRSSTLGFDYLLVVEPQDLSANLLQQLLGDVQVWLRLLVTVTIALKWRSDRHHIPWLPIYHGNLHKSTKIMEMQ